MEQESKDKGGFVIGFLATALAFTAFKEELSGVNMTVFGYTHTLFQWSLVFFGLLSLSAYLYALEYLKFTFGAGQNNAFFKGLVLIASVLYSFAMLYPVGLLLIWLLSLINFSEHFDKYFSYLTYIINIGLAIYSGVFTERLTKRFKVEKLDEKKREYLDKALRLYASTFYGECIQEAFKTVNLALREKLLADKGMSSKHMPFGELLKLAIDNNIILPAQVNSLKELQQLRNFASHSAQPFSKAQADRALEISKEILEHTYTTEE